MEVVTARAGAGAAEASLIVTPREDDYLDLAQGKAAADVITTFRSSAGTGRLAFWIEAAEDAAKRGPLNCLPQIPSEPYALRGIPEGRHRIHAVLWEPLETASSPEPASVEELLETGGFVVLTRATVSFSVRRFEDFVAAYDWKPVERWHRLPPGLEVALDMGESQSRKAKIPQPWQWDVQVDEQEGRQRVPVEADTPLLELLTRLGLTTSTHELIWSQGGHERVLQPTWTARQTDLFRYAQQIRVRRFATIVD